MKSDYLKFQAVGAVRDFASRAAQMVPVGQKVRIIGIEKSVDVDVASYIKNDMQPATVCKWLQLVRAVMG